MRCLCGKVVGFLIFNKWYRITREQEMLQRVAMRGKYQIGDLVGKTLKLLYDMYTSE